MILIIDGGTPNLRVTLLSDERKPLDSIARDGGVRHTAQHTEHGGRIALGVFRELLFDLQQVGSSNVDLVGSQFDLEGAPLAVGQLEHSVDLLIIIVLIML